MIKSLLFCVSLTVSMFSFASPAVQDSVTYEGLLTTSSGMNAGFIQELTLSSFEAVKLEFQLDTVMYLPDGSEKKDTQTISMQELKTNAEILEILKNCETLGGRKENLVVNAGEFETCAFEDGKGGSVWMGAVPFNIVKQISIDPDGTKVQLELTLYRWGK